MASRDPSRSDFVGGGAPRFRGRRRRADQFSAAAAASTSQRRTDAARRGSDRISMNEQLFYLHSMIVGLELKYTFIIIVHYNVCHENCS